VTPRARAAVAIAGLAGGGAIAIALVATRGDASAAAPDRHTPMARMLIVTSRARTITWADVLDLRGPAQDAVASVAGWEQGTDMLSNDSSNWSTRVIGTEPDYADTRGWTVARGAFLTDNSARQVVLGATVAHQLFASADPIGATVRIHDRAFEVIGVLAAKGTSRTGQDYDDVAIVPAPAFEGLHPAAIDLRVDVVAAGEDRLDDAEHEVDHLLRVRHHLAAGVAPDYQIRNLGKLLALRPELRSEVP
jgi:putative ABC transport system permease protein